VDVGGKASGSFLDQYVDVRGGSFGYVAILKDPCAGFLTVTGGRVIVKAPYLGLEVEVRDKDKDGRGLGLGCSCRRY
jgi:hypothetical protein